MPLALPELGLIGASGLANPRDFRAPVAAYDDSERPFEVIHKIAGNLWRATYDPSIMTALTSATDTPGVANVDFVVLPPRWLVTEDTFRPNYYHRNVMSEYVGMVKEIQNGSSARRPGFGELTNMMTPHGPRAPQWESATQSDLAPEKTDGLFFMLESQWPILLTAQAAQAVTPEDDDGTWGGHERHFRR